MSAFPTPFIPESAPFAPAQRDWLNSMLADLFAHTPRPAVEPAALEIDVLFASQSGTAERLARTLAKHLRQQQFVARVHSLATLLPDALRSMQHAVVLASTYGEGEPPECAAAFVDALFADAAPQLPGLRFSVFCLGDRNYEQFCRFGIELDERLAALGATRLQPRIECDVDVDAPFEGWRNELLARFAKDAVTASTESTAAIAAVPVAPPVLLDETTAAPTPTATGPTRHQPFAAPLAEKTLLTDASSSKQTVHLAFDLEGSGFVYEPGDACGVLPQNDPTLVTAVLAALQCSGDENIVLPSSTSASPQSSTTLADALHHHLQLTTLPRKHFAAFARKSESAKLLALLEPSSSAALDDFLPGLGILDLMQAYPGVVTTPQQLADLLPRLAPRLYSISSSPRVHPGQVHCTVAVVRFHAHGSQRHGVASSMLFDRVAAGTPVPIYPHRNTRFRIPSDPARPIVMIGPGTGIAPFRAFLQERQALGHTGRNWLFFGERSARTDFLYQHELQRFVADGHLTRLDTAFSRDQQDKLYVQHRMLEAGAEFFRWLEDGASVYVCGDASRMAKDVDAALQQVLRTHGGLSEDAAQEYVSHLNHDHRYHRDVY